jgi:hypothetical protein
MPGGGCGVAFEVSPSGKSSKFKVLHRFGGPDGASPTGALVMDASGSLYGAAGSTVQPNGLIFALTPHSNGWKETILYQFSAPPDASGPSSVIFGSSEEIYGTATQGGASDAGAIFEMQRSGNDWSESVPFSFNTSDGNDPVSLVSGSDGNYYGTAWIGGTGSCQGPGCGLVYEFVP